MKLKISTPEKTIYEWEVRQITLPTENWEITINSSSSPLVSSLKPGIVKIIPEEPISWFIYFKNEISISTDKGMAFVDGKIIRIVVSSATTLPNQSLEALNKIKSDLETKIQELKKKGSIEEIEKSLIKLEKIKADIKLEEIKESK